MNTDWQSAEAVVARLRDSLRDAIADHQKILDFLLQRNVEPIDLSDLSVVLEDASNMYMAMSESVCQKLLNSQPRR